MSKLLSRRRFLGGSGLIGCSVAASPILTPLSFAAAPWDMRLVVIILRGGMDSLDVLRPVGDPSYAALRPGLLAEAGLDLDGFHQLHPALGALKPMWQAGELGFVRAVATPYRNKRSHFDGQDLLEAGSSELGAARGGWLNRALGLLPGTVLETGFSIGHGELKVLSGETPVAGWYPEQELAISPQAQLLARSMYRDDPLFLDAFSRALHLDAEEAGEKARAGETTPRGAHVNVARYAAEQLRGDTRIAAFSLNGWDTHRTQKTALPRALHRLSHVLTTLKTETGPSVWGQTAVLAMTEFGRTARENGTGGTDHGTGGALIFAGGAIRGGRVLGQWPGLTEADLLDRRDLTPTSDLRAHVAGVLQTATGLNRADLEDVVFPGLDLHAGPPEPIV